MITIPQPPTTSTKITLTPANKVANKSPDPQPKQTEPKPTPAPTHQPSPATNSIPPQPLPQHKTQQTPTQAIRRDKPDTTETTNIAAKRPKQNYNMTWHGQSEKSAQWTCRVRTHRSFIHPHIFRCPNARDPVCYAFPI